MSRPSPAAGPDPNYGTLEYFQEELKAPTAWRRIAAAQSLANKAAENFKLRLAEDYAGTLGVSAAETTNDEAMVRDVEAQVDEYRQQCIAMAQKNFAEHTHTVAGENGKRVSPVLALFRLATLTDDLVDKSLDIALAENMLSVGDQLHSFKDGFLEGSFDINDPTARQYAIKAMIAEQDQTLFRSTVAT